MSYRKRSRDGYLTNEELHHRMVADIKLQVLKNLLAKLGIRTAQAWTMNVEEELARVKRYFERPYESDIANAQSFRVPSVFR